jgi:hypothetical protein
MKGSGSIVAYLALAIKLRVILSVAALMMTIHYYF